MRPAPRLGPERPARGRRAAGHRALPPWRRGAALLGAAYVIASSVACASPEARRTRGGGPGADPGNRRAAVQLHAGADPYYGTPCATTLPRCDGPRPVFGRQ